MCKCDCVKTTDERDQENKYDVQAPIGWRTKQDSECCQKNSGDVAGCNRQRHRQPCELSDRTKIAFLRTFDNLAFQLPKVYELHQHALARFQRMAKHILDAVAHGD